MTKADTSHQPVLFNEVIEGLNVKPDGVYVDGTFGRGGHARAILALLGEHGRLILFDRDPDAIAWARQQLSADQRVTIVHDDFATLSQHLDSAGLHQQVDGVLLDLGVSSPQLDDAGRGFSFQHDGPLDMRMDNDRGVSAADWINSAAESEIAEVLWRYGEERHSRRIARRIVKAREENPIRQTGELANLISDCMPKGKEAKHPATRSFQAIRIFINRELDQLTGFLHDLFDILKIGGRVLIISFHSLEDRIVKRYFRQFSVAPALPKGLPLREVDSTFKARLRTIGKAVKAGPEEVGRNPRARSAVLRIAERTA